MKLNIRHTFPCTVAQFWTSYWDEGFAAEVRANSPIRKEELADETVGGVRVVRQRYHSTVELPSAVRGVLGMDHLSWEQEVRVDEAQSRLTWKVFPPLYKDKVKAEGFMTVVAVDGGCERVLTGDVEVPIPLFGRKIEQGVIDNLTKSEEITAVLRTRWLKRTFPA